MPRKKRPQHCLTKCLKPKRPTQHSHWKNNINNQKQIVFLKNDFGWQKNLEHREKLIKAIQNERVLRKAMTCCKNALWLSLKTNSAFKKAFKFQGKKNAHSTVLQNAWSQKDQHFHWKNKFDHQKPIVFIEKRSWITKKPRAPWKLITAIQN